MVAGSCKLLPVNNLRIHPRTRKLSFTGQTCRHNRQSLVIRLIFNKVVILMRRSTPKAEQLPPLG